MKIGRIIAVVVLVAAVIFAFTGGQYPLKEFEQLQDRKDVLAGEVDSLNTAIESMAAFRDSLRDDKSVQERVIRARIGMIEPGEMAILLVPVDSVAASDSGR